MFCTNYYFCCSVAYFHLTPLPPLSCCSTCVLSLSVTPPAASRPCLYFLWLWLCCRVFILHFCFHFLPRNFALICDRDLPSSPPPLPHHATGIDDTAIVLCVSVCLIFAAIVCSGNAMLFLRICLFMKFQLISSQCVWNEFVVRKTHAQIDRQGEGRERDMAHALCKSSHRIRNYLHWLQWRLGLNLIKTKLKRNPQRVFRIDVFFLVFIYSINSFFLHF